MNKTNTLIFTLCILPFFAFSQEGEEQIASEICIGLSKLDLTQHPNTINSQAKKIFIDVYTANGAKMQERLNHYLAKNKGMEAEGARKKVGQEILFFLMKDCESFQRITMFDYGPVPAISETILKVGKDFTVFFNEKLKTNKMDADMVDECIMLATIENYDLLKATYGDLNSSEFYQDLNAYLMTKCIPYMRWTVASAGDSNSFFPK